MCSMEDEQQTPVTPILLNNHPKPHPTHSKGHVQPPYTFLVPPFDQRSTLPLLFCSRYQSKQRYHCGVEACSSRAPSRVTATGLHDNSAQPWQSQIDQGVGRGVAQRRPMPWRQQTGLHDNSAQPWREPDRPRRWQRRCSKSARCPGANKADYTTTTTDPGLDTSNQGGHARRRSGGRPKTSRPSGYQRVTTGRRTNMERRMYRCDNMRVVCH